MRKDKKKYRIQDQNELLNLEGPPIAKNKEEAAKDNHTVSPSETESVAAELKIRENGKDNAHG
jgi:hypothetical protein